MKLWEALGLADPNDVRTNRALRSFNHYQTVSFAQTDPRFYDNMLSNQGPKRRQ